MESMNFNSACIPFSVDCLRMVGNVFRLSVADFRRLTNRGHANRMDVCVNRVCGP